MPDDDAGRPDLSDDTGLERIILGEEPAFTAAEVAERAGMPLDQARRLWRTLGFPERGEEQAYTAADVESLREIRGAIEEGFLDLDLALNVARGVGLSLGRLADWEVGALSQRVAAIDLDLDPDAHDRDPASRFIELYASRFENLLVYAWRRHLTAAVVRMQAARALDDDPQISHLTVGFADIVSFTALSNEISREKVGDLVELFEARCGDVIAAQSGRLIKSMGDAVLFVNDDPMRAFATAEGIITVIGRDSRMPDVRVGLATGSVILRLGDVFGPPVNLAARLTQVARRNRIIVDRATADLLPADQIESRSLPERPVRGFGVVEPVAVRRT